MVEGGEEKKNPLMDGLVKAMADLMAGKTSGE